MCGLKEMGCPHRDIVHEKINDLIAHIQYHCTFNHSDQILFSRPMFQDNVKAITDNYNKSTNATLTPNMIPSCLNETFPMHGVIDEGKRL